MTTESASGRPIFVVGFQRSGTTLLQSLLGAHSHIAAPPEVHFFFRVYQLRDYWGDLSDDRNAARVVRELVNAPFGLLEGCGFDETALTQAFLTTDRSYGALLRTVLADFAARQGKARWSEKTPNQRPRLIWSVIPDAQVVHIVRDPREVVASAVTAWPHDAPPWALAERLGEFTAAVQADAQSASPESYLLIRYEDLATDPDTTLRALCEFLDEEFEPQMTSTAGGRSSALPKSEPAWQAEAVTAVRPPRTEWNTRLSLAQRALVSAAARGSVHALGYPPVPRGWLVAGVALAPLRMPFRFAQRARNRKVARIGSPQEKYEAVQEFLRTRRLAEASPD